MLNEDKSGWHVIVKMPNDERISRYIKKESCFQVQALANLKFTYVSRGIFELLKYRKYRYCYMLLYLLTNQSTMYDRHFNLKEMDSFNCLKKKPSIEINY